MKVYGITELVELSRKKSLFYRCLYENLPPFSGNLTELPVTPDEAYKEANTFYKNKVITEKMQGILLRSGGTTGKPKISIFSSEEWHTLSQITINKLCETNLIEAGARVANMFVSGNLYGSFLLMSNALSFCKFPILELPIGGAVLNVEAITYLLKELSATVILGTPYCIVAIAAFIKQNNIKGIKLNRFLYGGDILLDSQFLFLKDLFPDSIISSSGYASTDSGFLGYSDKTCNINEYRTDSHFTYIELLETNTQLPIDKENKSGILVATNLTRSLTPVIRYPTGDLAMWIEKKHTKNRKIKLVGRYSKECDLIKIGENKYNFQDIYSLIKPSRFIKDILGFQIHINRKDQIIFKIVLMVQDNKIKKIIVDEIYGLLLTSLYGNLPTDQLRCEAIDISQLEYDSRTYKVVKIIKE